MEPSAMREVFVEVPDVKWEDIGGLGNVKQELQEAVEWPLKYQNIFTHADATPPMMLYQIIREISMYLIQLPISSTC